MLDDHMQGLMDQLYGISNPLTIHIMIAQDAELKRRNLGIA